jgi:hypothetical protein
VLVPPALLLVVELAAGAVSRPARVALHTAFVAVLAAAFAIGAIKAAVHGDAAPIALAAALGVAFATAYARAAPVRSS